MADKHAELIKRLEVLIRDTEWSDIVDLSPEDAEVILGLLKEQPEIVLCKECEHGAPHKNYRGEYGILCHNVRGSTNGYVHNENWFCGDGEKR